MPDLPHELFRAAQVRELDRLAIEQHGVPGYTLMTRAGRAVFHALQRQWPGAKRLAVVCGAGNNAGDGYVVAGLAHQAGLQVTALWLGDPERLRGDAESAYREARQQGVPIQAFAIAGLQQADVVVDAILGTGLEREVSGDWRQAIEAINALEAGVLAVDIPSGLHADCGSVMGVAVRADLTVSFIGLKQGLFTGEGPTCSGEILFDDLEVPAAIYRAVHPSCRRYTGSDRPRLLPRRPRSAHKGDHGHVLVVGGDLGMAGAARMAAEAAARTGAGLVSVATRVAHAAQQAAIRPELMVRGVETPSDLQPLLERATVIALGPGLGRSSWGKDMLRAVLATQGLPLVVDADALNALAAEPAVRKDWILTPHPGEAGRLLRMNSAQIQADRFTAASEIALRFGGVCVLKGAGTLVAERQEGLVLCDCGNPGMASGGMGDVLTGIIAGLLAQGLTPWQAARTGAYLHGRAGDLAAQAGERGMLALDLMPMLRELVNPRVA